MDLKFYWKCLQSLPAKMFLRLFPFLKCECNIVALCPDWSCCCHGWRRAFTRASTSRPRTTRSPRSTSTPTTTPSASSSESHTHTHTYTHTYIIHTHTYTHLYIHIHTHTYTHMPTYIHIDTSKLTSQSFYDCLY